MDWLWANHTLFLFPDLDAKKIKCRSRLTGEVSTLPVTGLFWVLGIEYRYPALCWSQAGFPEQLVVSSIITFTLFSENVLSVDFTKNHMLVPDSMCELSWKELKNLHTSSELAVGAGLYVAALDPMTQWHQLSIHNGQSCCCWSCRYLLLSRKKETQQWRHHTIRSIPTCKRMLHFTSLFLLRLIFTT